MNEKKFLKIRDSFQKEKARMKFSSEKTEPIETDNGARLNFAVFGDPQVSSLSPVRAVRLSAACDDISRISKPLDALVLTGDVAEYGSECEYALAAEILNGASHSFRNFFAVSGNHDVRLRNYKSQLKVFNKFISSVSGGICGGSEHYYFSREINGYKFIMLGTDAMTFEASYLSEEQLSWLDRELSENDRTGLPCFVFNHQTLKNHNGLPQTWLGKGSWRGSTGRESDKLKEIFEKHGNIIFITGHLHWCTNRFSFEDYGTYKCLSVPTVGVNNHGDYPVSTQSYFISVFNDKILLKSRIFGEGRYTDCEIPNSTVEISL